MAKTTKFLTFTLDFGSKLGFFEGWCLKNSLGNISSKFYCDLYLLKIIEKWVYFLWRSFFPWDRFWLNLLCCSNNLLATSIWYRGWCKKVEISLKPRINSFQNRVVLLYVSKFMEGMSLSPQNYKLQNPWFCKKLVN